MTDMINMSRLSNGMRAAGMMRRSLTEALFIARHRVAFGKALIELPLMRRQLLKIMLLAESARSVMFHAAAELERADAGDESARRRIRILTPLLKFRACRDARRATGDAMEVRGGCGYIEEWSDARLVRDAHLGSIWEGTSNVVALDVMRAVRREGALDALEPTLEAMLPKGRVRRCVTSRREARSRVRAGHRDPARRRARPAGRDRSVLRSCCRRSRERRHAPRCDRRCAQAAAFCARARASPEAARSSSLRLAGRSLCKPAAAGDAGCGHPGRTTAQTIGRHPLMAGSLSHIRVLDLSRVLAGPWAAQNLGDLGAEIIKVERPGAGDDTRGWGPPFLKDGAGKDTKEAAYYASVNRNKKSITLDLSKPRDKRSRARSRRRAQVLIENYKVGTLKRYGLGYEDLKKRTQASVYCSVTGFGPGRTVRAPPRLRLHLPGHGRADVDHRRARRPAGRRAAEGRHRDHRRADRDVRERRILAALTHRERTGEGQYIDCALLDTIVAFNANQIVSYFCSGRIPIRYGNAHAQGRAVRSLPDRRRPHHPSRSATTASSSASARSRDARARRGSRASRPTRSASCIAPS
jgi:hypothetical protein